MRKTKFVLEAIAESGKVVTYYAVDLSESSLRASLLPLTKMFPSIRFVGLWGTYDDSVAWIRRSVPADTPKMYLWLGSSIGNLTREEAASFLRGIVDGAMEPGDLFLCGIDRRNSFEALSLAYNDSHGLTREFILNGLDHVNAVFDNQPVFDRADFEYVSIYNEVDGRHEAYYRALRAHTVSARDPDFSVDLAEGELINVEYSYKYSAQEVATLLDAARLHHVGKWTDAKGMYDLHLFQKPAFFFPRASASPAEKRAERGQPSLAQFEELWKLWDLITGTMIAPDNHLFKPISLRHPYLFYVGHMPGFADIQLSRVLGLELTPPQQFADIFERGIDPDTEDPSKCHPHSAVPEQWPALSDVRAYQDRVRERIRGLYASTPAFPRRVQRVLFMCFEHEAMHAETLLYMLVQDPRVQPPARVARPILESTQGRPTPAAHFVAVEGGECEAGIDDAEDQDDAKDALADDAVFGWDNEGPMHALSVPPFEIQDRPVTVGEYYTFLASRQWDAKLVPDSWGLAPGQMAPHYSVKTAFGLIAIDLAWRWPAFVSNDQATAYADAHGARLPTEDEIAFLRYTGQHQPAADASLATANFVSWTPRDVRFSTSAADAAITDLDGNGWEHTSTEFMPFDGFVASKLYPGYSSDFFDHKHNVVLGASWATVERIASRKTFRNWYQRAYPFVFAKFRLAR
nr:hypothetical protein HK105_002580 [Polyrhizophydium stewartii]